MNTYHIHLAGIVQGVGFRPMVYNVAKQFHLNGMVTNSSAGVDIVFNADAEEADAFYQSILQHIPPQSRVTEHDMAPTESKTFSNFTIGHSLTNAITTVFPAPDFAMCDACREELNAPFNKRNNYAFITCTQCGPRYSILWQLPYDRVNTSMQLFDMCETCATEYADPTDRRFYSQTNSCPTCGVQLKLHIHDQVVTGQPSIQKTIELILSGKIVALKGIGGYLLLCDATNMQALQTLRERKHRPTKPFAVLYPNDEILKGDLEINQIQLESLHSPASPIVLIPLQNNPKSGIKTDQVAPQLLALGVMLPYAPLMELIASGVSKPIIATSANISNSPIIYQDSDALEKLFVIADAVLTHNREIVTPQDDSVIRFTNNKQPIILRRSRGLAPSYFPSVPFTDEPIVAMGAQLKSTIALLHQGNLYVSQYIGDLESADTEENYHKILEHLLTITNAKPTKILIDNHPDYASAQTGILMAKKLALPVEKIQHHQAHFAAVMAENNCIHEKVLGVIWDGTGLGEDHASWGGEFFTWNGECMKRTNHFNYFPLLLGDKMARDPRLSALSLSEESNRLLLKEKFTEAEWKIYTALLKAETQCTSSVGRLFDGIAAWCGLCNHITYEGEAALLLEDVATRYYRKNSKAFDYYPVTICNGLIDTQALMKTMVPSISSRNSIEHLAFKFHCTLVEIIRTVAEREQLKSIAFSGGVFQNALLVELIQQHLSAFTLYFHRQLSPNDECISFGQLAYDQFICVRDSKSKALLTEKIFQ